MSKNLLIVLGTIGIVVSGILLCFSISGLVSMINGGVSSYWTWGRAIAGTVISGIVFAGCVFLCVLMIVRKIKAAFCRGKGELKG